MNYERTGSEVAVNRHETIQQINQVSDLRNKHAEHLNFIFQALR